jgi:hypothetical protein
MERNALPCDEEDKALFRASMTISLGNGKKTQFWHDKWLNGSTPINLALNLYKLERFKSRSVEKELQNKRLLAESTQGSNSLSSSSFGALSNMLT